MFKKTIASVALSGGLLVGASSLATPASSAPLFTGGLVNVNITDVVTENQINVQVPIGVAANVCGVSANVLAQRTSTAPVDCDSATTADLPVAFRR